MRTIADGILDLMRDIGGWLLLGVVIAGAITSLISDGFLYRYSNHELLSLAVMLLAGIPLYVCATASTPVAAALVMKGLSPGAAVVFLLAGPATNAATLTVLFRTMGARATLVYLGAIAAGSLGFGWLVNRIYELGGFTSAGWMSSQQLESLSLFHHGCAVIFLLIFLYAWRPAWPRTRKTLGKRQIRREPSTGRS